MITPYIFFDVGANDGAHSMQIAANSPETQVYAFEPTPELVRHLELQARGMNNYHVIPCAVSDYEGTSAFHVAAHGGGGCSSLLEFSNKVASNWPGRTDMQVTHTIDVPVIRLDTFMEQQAIPYISYLHIDTQGSDIHVLRGLGTYLPLVRAGVMEAANKPDILYHGQNTAEESIQFLRDAGFEVTHVEANDPHLNEVNIYFRNTK
jgi:FkbM family methyltransferase